MHPTTIAYKYLKNGAPIHLDFYKPITEADNAHESVEHRTPAVIYFHGGGLHVGNKASFPPWLLHYQLIPPASDHDIIQDIQDIQDLFAFLTKETLSADNLEYKVDENRIVVAGSSAGGYLAYLSAMHASPKPKGVFSAYSAGGNFLIPQYLQEKTKPFFMGRDPLDTSKYQDYIYSFPNGPIAPTSGIPILGVYLDYVTGQHEPSLSGALRMILADESKNLGNLEKAIPEEHRGLFPQLTMDASWHPTLLMHGTTDTAIIPGESYHLHPLLKAAKVHAVLLKIPEVDHLFRFCAERGREMERPVRFDQKFHRRMPPD